MAWSELVTSSLPWIGAVCISAGMSLVLGSRCCSGEACCKSGSVQGLSSMRLCGSNSDMLSSAWASCEWCVPCTVVVFACPDSAFPLLLRADGEVHSDASTVSCASRSGHSVETVSAVTIENMLPCWCSGVLDSVLDIVSGATTVKLDDVDALLFRAACVLILVRGLLVVLVIAERSKWRVWPMGSLAVAWRMYPIGCRFWQCEGGI